jgi:molecular chaperone HscA
LSGARPQSIVVVGGGANITSIARSLELRTGLTTLVPTMPELVSARGAALLSPDR